MSFPSTHPRRLALIPRPRRVLKPQFISIAAILAFCLVPLLVRALSTSKTPSTQDANRPAGLARLDERVSVHASSRGNPTVNLSDGRALLTSYVGPEDLRAALEGNRAEPLSLASADFDEDGVPDLVSGYAYQGRGIVTLLRGNVDAIYENSPEAQKRRRNGTFTKAPFLSPAQVFESPVAAGFIGAGDFDGDSHWDVVIASRANSKLHLFSGNGKGELSLTREISLPGQVTAFTTGEINRRDGLADVIVGVKGPAGAAVLVFEGPVGALRNEPEAFEMGAPVSDLSLGQLDDEYELDLVIAAGNQLVLVQGRDRKLSLDADEQAKVKAAHITKRLFKTATKSIVIGNFNSPLETAIALLMEDGSINVLTSRTSVDSLNLAHWTNRDFNRTHGQELVKARISSATLDSLLVLDHSLGELHILTQKNKEPTDTWGQASTRGDAVQSMELQLSGIPSALLPMRLNGDALEDLVLLDMKGAAPTLVVTAAAMTFTVNSSADPNSGICTISNCTLREAIEAANANPGVDTIRFSIGTGPQTIRPSSQLPTIVEAVTIDGTTQPGFAGSPIIEVRGTLAGDGTAGLMITAGSSSVRGLIISRFGGTSNATGYGILISTNGANIIEGNFLGTDSTGNLDSGNTIGGMAIFDGSTGNLIGGNTSSARNVISGNHLLGILIDGPSTGNNEIKGNHIGTNAAGSADLHNSAYGVLIQDNAPNTLIGGNALSSRNIISGTCCTWGIYQTSGSGTLVTANYIGTDATGTIALANNGVAFLEGASNNTIGGTHPAARNVIVGAGDAVFVKSSNNLVKGNFIGTDVTGTIALSGSIGGSGVDIFGGVNNIIGGNVTGSGNLISGNNVGITLENFATGNRITGNLIGTDVTGTVALGNREMGVRVVNSTNNMIGGSINERSNIISGNIEEGIVIFGGGTEGNEIQGNYIGTDLTGTRKLGNGQDGVFIANAFNTTIGGPTAGERNIISGNGRHGVYLGYFENSTTPTTGTLLQGNYIGTDVSGAAPLGNTQNGVFVDSFSVSNSIKDNLIAFNGDNGIGIPNGTSPGVEILINSNSIFSNTAFGIDLGPTGITANDPLDLDGGANLQQNFPVLTSFALSSPSRASSRTSDLNDETISSTELASVTVNGTLNSTPNTTFTIHWYFSTDEQCMLNQQGSQPLAFGRVPDIATDANGNAPFSFPFQFPPGTSGGVINCTATDPNGNTSEFSACLPVTAPPEITISDVSQSEGNSGTTAFTFSVNLSPASSQTVTVDYATADGSATVADNDYASASNTLTFNPGQTAQPLTVLVTGDAKFEAAETFVVNLSSPTNATISDNQGTGTILNDDSAVQFTAATFTVSENGGTASVNVTRSGDTTSAATVNYATSDSAALTNCNVFNGIASSRCDYASSVGTVNFAAGEGSKSFSIPIVNDSFAEGSESFTVTLSSPTGSSLGSQVSASVTINDNEASNGPNPISQTTFFVRQHYIDFLGREPDPAGFQGWQDIINNCPAGNITCDRVHVSGNFFQSPEFQQRGYFVYRFYPVAFGRKPDYAEFIPDIARVSGFLTDAQLEATRVAFVGDFMNRAAFATYNGLNNTQYVDTLLSTAAVAPHPTRDSWITSLGNGSKTRAQVLREIAESTQVYDKYYNQAFVVMQYFGYLRREPDAQYLVWITELNTTGNFRNMINGFMNSPEYTFRFGP